MCSPPQPSRIRERSTDPITTPSEDQPGVRHPPRRVHPSRNLSTPRQTDLDRDRLWCKALVAVLDVQTLNDVLVEFNKIRPD